MVAIYKLRTPSLSISNRLFQKDCSWLLRSPQTVSPKFISFSSHLQRNIRNQCVISKYSTLQAEFDLVNVEQMNWNVWTGIIAKGNEVMITCNECEQEADCNCMSNHSCYSFHVFSLDHTHYIFVCRSRGLH